MVMMLQLSAVHRAPACGGAGRPAAVEAALNNGMSEDAALAAALAESAAAARRADYVALAPAEERDSTGGSATAVAASPHAVKMMVLDPRVGLAGRAAVARELARRAAGAKSIPVVLLGVESSPIPAPIRAVGRVPAVVSVPVAGGAGRAPATPVKSAAVAAKSAAAAAVVPAHPVFKTAVTTKKCLSQKVPGHGLHCGYYALYHLCVMCDVHGIEPGLTLENRAKFTEVLRIWELLVLNHRKAQARALLAPTLTPAVRETRLRDIAAGKGISATNLVGDEIELLIHAIFRGEGGLSAAFVATARDYLCFWERLETTPEDRSGAFSFIAHAYDGAGRIAPVEQQTKNVPASIRFRAAVGDDCQVVLYNISAASAASYAGARGGVVTAGSHWVCCKLSKEAAKPGTIMIEHADSAQGAPNQPLIGKFITRIMGLPTSIAEAVISAEMDKVDALLKQTTDGYAGERWAELSRAVPLVQNTYLFECAAEILRSPLGNGDVVPYITAFAQQAQRGELGEPRYQNKFQCIVRLAALAKAHRRYQELVARIEAAEVELSDENSVSLRSLKESLEVLTAEFEGTIIPAFFA